MTTKPKTGRVYGFKTFPLSEFAPKDTGRFAAYKILATQGKDYVVGTFDFVGTKLPSLDDVRDSALLHEDHDGSAAVFGMTVGEDDVEALTPLTALGELPVTPEEKALADNTLDYGVGSQWASLWSVSLAAERKWRMAHDREALLAEDAKEKARRLAEDEARQQRYEQRLKNLTFDQLLSETPFSNWDASALDTEFIEAARARIRKACEALQAMGKKPRKTEARKVLEACVRWFNEADEKAGHVIETVEREDIHAVLEEMAFAARHPALAAEIDDWRDW